MALRYFEENESVVEQAQQLWNVLASWAVLKPDEEGLPKGLISYSKAGEFVGLPAVGMSRSLGIIGMLCEHEDIPRLNAIVVNKAFRVSPEALRIA